MKKILAILFMFILCFALGVTAAATEQRTTALDLTAQETADNLDTEGWAWDADTKTLTLDGIDISVTTGNAINAPAGTTVILAEGSTNKVVTTGTGRVYGIHINGDMTIYSADSANQGTLNVQSSTYGIGTRPGLSEAKDFNLSISNIKLAIHTKAGINICVENNSAHKSDVSLSMSGVDYDYTAPDTNCAYQIITHNGDSSVSLTNGTTSDGGTMTNWASGKTTLTVTDSTLTTGSRENHHNNNSIELGNGSANAVELNIQNSKIVAIDGVGHALSVRPNGSGTNTMNISNSDFLLIGYKTFTGISSLPEGNDVTAVSHNSWLGADTDAEGNKTLNLPAGTTITSGGTYTIAEGSTPTVSFVAEDASMIIPAKTELKTGDTGNETIIKSEGIIVVFPGKPITLPKNETTTVILPEKDTIEITPKTPFNIGSNGTIEVPAGTIVKKNDEEAVILENGGKIKSDGTIEPNPVPAPAPCDHKLDANGKCSRCGVVIISYEDGEPSVKDDETNPSTGAPVVAPFAVLALGAIALCKKK